MKTKTLAAIMLTTMCTLLTACGGPPKDEAIKNLLAYLEKDGVLLEDIKFVSSYAKDGGYTVNLMAGQATCEMPMLKVDGKWIAKGMSCNGSYFTPDQAKERRKTALIKSYKEEAAKLNTKLPKTDQDGVRTDKITFENNQYIVHITAVNKSNEYTEAVKKEKTVQYQTQLCSDMNVIQALDAGIVFGIDATGVDGKLAISPRVTAEDCKKLGNY